MIDGILNLIVFVVAVSAFVILPVARALVLKDEAESKGAPVRVQASRRAMVMIGGAWATLCFLAFLELDQRLRDTLTLVIAAVLLVIPVATFYAALLAPYHVWLWVRSKRRNPQDIHWPRGAAT